jgi:rubrerythrin
MDIGSIFLILAVLIPVVIFIARPLMERKSTAVTVEEHDYSALLAERDRVLTALQELEFDHNLGKIPEEEYPTQRASLMRYGAEILRQIDEYEGLPDEKTEDDPLEAAIASRKAATAVIDPDDELEAMIAARRREQKSNGQSKTGGFCPQCGNCVQESDQFCPKCGEALA